MAIRAASTRKGWLASESWNTLAVPGNEPRIVAGTPSRFMVPSIVATAVLSETPGGRLNEMVVATRRPWWLTASGVAPWLNFATAESGIMVSCLVDTAEPVEAEPLPVWPIELVAWLRAACVFAAAAALEFDADTTVPATALVPCEPPTEPPEVET